MERGRTGGEEQRRSQEELPTHSYAKKRENSCLAIADLPTTIFASNRPHRLTRSGHRVFIPAMRVQIPLGSLRPSQFITDELAFFMPQPLPAGRFLTPMARAARGGPTTLNSPRRGRAPGELCFGSRGLGLGVRGSLCGARPDSLPCFLPRPVPPSTLRAGFDHDSTPHFARQQRAGSHGDQG